MPEQRHAQLRRDPLDLIDILEAHGGLVDLLALDAQQRAGIVHVQIAVVPARPSHVAQHALHHEGLAG
jgi:hypothetical protein